MVREIDENLLLFSSKFAKQKGYWESKLSGELARTEILLKDTEFNQADASSGKDSEKDKIEIQFPSHLAGQVDNLCKNSALSIYMLLLTTLEVLIYKYVDHNDPIIISPVFQPNISTDTINTYVLIRNAIKPGMTFKELLLEVRQATLGAYDNQDYPSSKLIDHLFQPEENPGYGNISHILCLLENIHDPKSCRDLKKTLVFSFIFEAESRCLSGTIFNNHADCESVYLKQIAGHFIKILASAMGDINRSLATIDILTEEEKHRLLYEFNHTASEYPADKAIPQLFAEQVRQTPNCIAIVGIVGADPRVCPGLVQPVQPVRLVRPINLTYRQLNAQANQLAAVLIEKGVLPDTIVGIMVERSVEMIIGIMGILKAGGAYLPIEPEYPQERIDYMLKDSAARILINKSEIRNSKFETNPNDQKINDPNKNFAIPIVLNLDHLNFEFVSDFDIRISNFNSSNLAYIIYTSGTTGKPKGVMIEHRSVVNLVSGLKERIYGPYKAGLKIGMLSPYVFDASVKQIFGALLLGHCLYIVPETARFDAAALLKFYIKHKIAVSDGTPAHIRLLLEVLKDHKNKLALPVKHFIIGGETLSKDNAVTFYERMGSLYKQDELPDIINVYGPTECCVDTTLYRVSEKNVLLFTHIPLGRPMPNYRVYILGREKELLPIGVAGELCISGTGVARGYLNSQALSQQKFIDNPLVKNEKLYCSGDLVRWMPDGNIVFLGRLDHQVKVRGFRIELAEIETLLLGHEMVKKAIVTAREDMGEDKYLCAYIVPHNPGSFEINPLREYLSGKLPTYAVPAHFAVIEEIPLTPNGKVDRGALPKPELRAGEGYAAPRDEVEEKLVMLWAEILSRDELRASQLQTAIGIADNFFQLGGHSLKATILASRIEKTFNVKMPLSEIFKNPQISELAGYIKAAVRCRHKQIELAEKKEYYVLSSAQKRLYFLQQMDKGGTAYNIPSAWIMEGILDRNKLAETFVGLVKRHESLRTSFVIIGEEPVQRIHNKSFAELLQKRLPEGPPEAIIKSFIRPFELSRAPLLRVGLVRLAEEKHIFLVDIHHIIADGVSVQVLMQEFSDLYAGKTLPGITLRYKDYAEWQNRERGSENIQAQGQYWKKEYEGEIPLLELPADYARSAVQVFEGHSLNFEIAKEIAGALKTLALERGATLYIVLLSLYTILLAKLTGQEEIVIGTPVAGRRHVDLEKTIGMFVNTLALRNYPAGEKSFSDFLGEIKAKALEGFENQEYQYEDLVENVVIKRDLSRNPLFDTMFTLQNTGSQKIESPGLKLISSDFENKTSKFDLTLTVVELEEKLQLTFEYSTKLFKRETIERFIVYFKNIARRIAENKNRRICDLEILTEEEKKRLLFEFNNTEAQYPANKTIHQLFAEQVAQTPDRIALVGADPRVCPELVRPINLTYRQLNAQSGLLAGVLIEKGVLADTIVGIMMERSVEMIIGIMGILKSGGAYLPIDPEYPQERIDYMLKDSNAKVLIINKSEVRNPKSETNPNDQKINDPNKNHHFGIPFVLNFEHLNFDIFSDFDIRASNLLTSNIAYIIYTSGSTGKPKGVLTVHRNVTRVVKNTNYIDITHSDRILQLSNYAFDGSVFDIFGALLNGAGLVMISRMDVSAVDRLSEMIQRAGITVFFITTALFNTLVDLEIQCFNNIRKVLFGGERVSPAHSGKALAYLGKGKIIHVYGPTETTVYATYYFIDAIDENAATIPIGKPLANTTVYILDKSLNPVTIGVPGEIYIGGAGVARGYLNQPELSAEKFKFNKSYRSYKTYILYKTGDLARWLPDGNVEFLGRIDHQVKIRGFRVEPGEIESRLLNYPGVKEAVVLAREEEKGDNYLCAYIVTGREYGIPGLREYLSKELPDYMIPSYFVRLEKIPLTPNGKVDRGALPRPELKVGDNYIAPRNEIETKLVEIWSEVLGQTAIGIDDNFFQLGGHSLKATIMMSRIHKELNAKVQLIDIFRIPTIRAVALLIQGLKKEAFQAIKPVEKKEYYPLSSAQKRLYFLQQFDLRSTSYNMPMALPLGQEIKKDKLEFALKQLITRHESLRTSFQMLNKEVVQRIHESVAFEMEYKNLSTDYTDYTNYTDGRGAPPWSPEIIKKFIRPFDLSRAPLIRSGLITLPDGCCTWMVDVHHIISDGTSQTVLAEDFMRLYETYETGAPLEPLPLQYKDFAQWQNQLFAGGWIKNQETYWLKLYAGEIPRLNLAADYKRPGVFTFEGDCCQFKLERETAVKFKALCARYGGTLYMNIMAVLNTLFYKYTGQTDIIIGSGIAGRRHADIQGVVGMFVNTLAMRNYPSGEKTYENFLLEVIAGSVKGFENQDIQFEELVEKLEPVRDPSRNPIFDISMVVQNFKEVYKQLQGKISLGNSSLSQYKNKTSKFDLTFFVSESEDDVYITIEYYTPIFKQETIARLINHFKNTIQSVIKNPSSAIKDIDILSEKEKEQVLYEFNNTGAEFPRDKTIHRLIEEQVVKTPDYVSLVYKNQILSYRELDRQANRLAHYLLAEKKINIGEPVGVWMNEPLYRQVVLLGILKAGGAFVPLDPAIPAERIEYIIEDARIGVMISEKHRLKDLNRMQWECAHFHSYLGIDSTDIHAEAETEINQLMDPELWQHVGENAADEITGGGWLSSYTGLPISREEMAEYGDNILKKLEPLLSPGMKVLEIGCASGITMYRIAPKVGYYYGTDLSAVIIETNKKKIKENGFQNIQLACLAAHEIDQVPVKDFDLVIINSVIQCFHGHNYLRQVLQKAITLLGDNGYLFIGDVMNQEKKGALVRELTAFKEANRHKGYTTKTDFSAELFVAPGFWQDLAAEWDSIETVTCSDKLFSIENELTKFRYDVLVKVSQTPKAYREKCKYQDDMRAVSRHGGVWLDGDRDILSSNLAYIIYTSGSTGKPKGVMVGHRSLVNFCCWHNTYYAVTSRDRATMYAGFSFDASVSEFFPFLLTGASICLVPEEIKLDIEALNRYYENNGVTVSFLPTQVAEQFMTIHNMSLRILETGGDRLKTFVKRNYQFYNCYGPTENTICASSYLVTEESGNIPIGKPVANNQVYILDRDNHLQPVGVPGELCIGGVSLARGYLNQPELTADKFYRSYESYKTYIIYKTGDLARWLPDGNIEFLGRMDQQVKIRGFRIELGEIEARLCKHYSVKQSVVIDRNENGETYLCAYIVSLPGEPVDPSELGSYLSRFLPGYMIPNHFIEVDSIPVTINGKIDKKALSMPRFIAPGDYIAPANAVEDQLAFIWSEVLALDRGKISMDANFFQSGGHSLKAIQLTAAIHRSFNVKIALADLFKFPTIRGIAAAISKMEKTLFTDIKKAEEKDFYELSFNQKRLWFIRQMDPAGSAYNMPGRIILNHQVEGEWIEKTLDQLLHRHESLRTSFTIIADRPVQRLSKDVSIPLKKIDLSMLDSEAKQRQQEEIFKETAGTPFDLMVAPLFRAVLLKLEPQIYEFMFNMHHIITDGWSMEIIKRDFTLIYEGFRAGKTVALESLPFQYKDFVEWNNDRLQVPLHPAGSHSYWRTKLENGIPGFALPADFTGGRESRAGAGYYCMIEKDITQRIRQLVEGHNTTLFTVLFSVYMLLLSRVSGEQEVACSIIAAGRKHASLHPIVGFFVNAIIYNTRVDFKTSFAKHLEQVKGDTLELFQHQDYPLELVFEELGMRYPEISVTFNMLSMQESAAAKELEPIVNAHVENSVEVKFDLEPYVTEYKNGLQIYWSYKKNMFRPATIAYMAEEYIRLLDYFSRNPGESYSDYRRSNTSVNAIPERKASPPLVPGLETLPRAFAHQVKKTPDGIAIKVSDALFTYAELNRCAGRIAGLIGRKLKLKQGGQVGLLFEHGYDMIAAIIGTLQAGKVYVPLAASYPVKRLSTMLSDSESVLILSNTQNMPLAVELAEENHIEFGNVHELNRNSACVLPKEPAITSDSPAYILYTSGSTGNPKGVIQTHENVLYFIKQYASDLAISPKDHMTLFSSFAHDAAVMDIFGALFNGAVLYPLAINTEGHMASLAGWLKKEGITIWHSVPTVFRYFAGTIDRNGLFPRMRWLVLGGEAVRRHDINMCREFFPHTTFGNLYGQTESSYNAMEFIAPGTAVNEIVLGKTAAGMTIFIADSEGNEVLALETGEIVVACPHVALGYWKNDEATQKAFSRHPVYGKIYRTGDMGRLLLDGNIQFIGRKDSQVKIRGFRIELGEIESRLLKHESINEAIVNMVEVETGDRFLCAYIVCNRQSRPDMEKLKAYLAELLPEYMIPAYFINLDTLPLTPGGKVNRKALPPPETGDINRTAPVAPRSWVEIKLQEIWREVLRYPGDIGIDDDFFQLGGHSLRATTLASRIQKAWHVNVPLTEIFKRPTIHGLSKYINAAKKERSAAIGPVEKKEYYALSPAQKRLYILHRMETESVNYNMPQVISFPGVIDVAKTQSVFKELIRRHESLRTSFEMINEEPSQRIHDEVAFEIKVFAELFSKSDPPEAMIKSFIRPFDLAKAPLLRAAIIKEENGTHILLVDMHHIITDGTSNTILKEEFNALYAGKGEDLAHLRLQYKDYASWQNSEVQQALIKEQESYWLNMFAEEVPVINLPADYPRPHIQDFAGSSVEFILNGKESDTLKRLANETGATLYISMLSVFTFLLSRLSGQEDIIVGTPVAARRHADLEKIIGMFVNTLALRNNVPPEASYREFVTELKDRTLNAYENQEYPFESLVEKINVVRDIAHNPVFDVMFNLLNIKDNAGRSSRSDLGSSDHYIHREGIAKFDLTLTAVDYAGGVRLSFEYGTRLFKPATIEQFIAYFKKILAELAINIDQKLAQIEIITQDERDRILHEFNNTAGEYPTNKTIHQLFAEQAEKMPDHIALVGADPRVCPVRLVSLTYGQLNKESDGLAGVLIKKGVQPGSIVGIKIERSVEMIIAIMGILKSGGAYLPIDPEYPPERIDYMLKDSGAKVLINKSEIRISKFETNPNDKNSNDQNQNHNFGIPFVLNFENLNLNSLKGCPRRGLSDFDIRASNFNSSNLAYIIYTSGTTGGPKGVMVPHASVVNLIFSRMKRFHIEEKDRVLQFSSLCFDASVEQIFIALSSGAVSVLIAKEILLDSDRFETYILRQSITHFDVVPSLLRQMRPDRLYPFKRIVSGGEICPVEIAKDWCQYYDFYNVYGPTETTVTALDILVKPVENPVENPDRVPVGKPINNTVIYLFGSHMNLAPLGSVGEIYIGGAGVARGYLNNPELTAAKFGPHITGIVYKTGDLGRFLADGNIEFLGRIDHQVKIRGFRIELGEIENRLLNYPGIKEVVVLAREEEKGDKYLCAYVVSDREYKISELRAYLANELPDYMIPAYFTPLEKIPLTPNGKIDRRALPKPVLPAGERYSAPRNEIEKKLAEIWSQVLKQTAIGIDDNFFQMGGHSLNATVLVSRIHQGLNVKLPLAQIFKTPTIRGLSGYIRGLAAELYESLTPVEEKEYYALSFAQERMYILQQLDVNRTAYNMPNVILLPGEFQVEKLAAAFKKLIARHDSLRTSFHMIDDRPVQIIHEKVEFKIEKWGSGERENFIRSFDLSQAPLLRVGLVNNNDGSYLLLVDMHHIIADGISHQVLTTDFMALYEGNKLPALLLQYKDFAQWQDSEKERQSFKSQEAYWLKEFAGEPPVLNLPYDYPRPLMQDFAGNTVTCEISVAEKRALNALAMQEGGTLFMVLAAVFNILLAKLSGQEEMIMGTPIAGRRHVDLEKIIGMFVNTLALKNYPAAERSFSEFLADVKNRTLMAFENQDYPFEKLVDGLSVKRDMGRNPLFDVMFAWQNFDLGPVNQEIETDFPGEYKALSRTAKFDLTLTAIERNHGLLLLFQYAAQLFKKETIERFTRYFKKIVGVIVTNSNIRLREIDILSEEEKSRILFEFNNTAVAYPQDKTLHQLFAEQAEKMPDHISLVGAGSQTCPVRLVGPVRPVRPVRLASLTYRQLNEESDRLAGVLIEKGVLADSIVGIMLERSIEMIIGILGILKAGGAYLPIDPGYPQERIDYMLKDSNARILINKSEIRNPKFETNSNETNPNDQNKNRNFGAAFVLNFGHLNFDIVSNFDIRASNFNSTNLAYIMFTSGSTGQPKGVLVTHRNVVRLVKNTNFIPLNTGTRILQTGAVVFDVSTLEIWGSLLNGGQLVLVAKETILDGRRLGKMIRNHKINTLWLTAPLFNQLLQENSGLFRPLNYLIVGGDVLSPGHINRLKRELPGLKIINGYGPTENATFSTTFEIDREYRENIPIGKPIANSTVYIVDKFINLQPAGIAGELCVGGDGVARGYLNNPELTAEKFIIKRFVGGPGGDIAFFKKAPLVYRTGDRARWLNDGNIEFLGRIDHQVKIRGFRIELEEIESQLMKHREIKEAVVLTAADENGDNYLCAYFAAARDFLVTELREYLLDRLPAHMIPSEFVQVEKIPLKNNGKVDRQTLISLGKKLSTGVEHVAPKSGNQLIIAKAWENVLKLPEVGIYDNFFDLGGTSLDMIRLNSQLKEVLKRDIPIVALYRYTTIDSFSHFLDTENTDVETSPSASQYTGHTDHTDKIKKDMANKNKRREIRSGIRSRREK